MCMHANNIETLDHLVPPPLVLPPMCMQDAEVIRNPGAIKWTSPGGTSPARGMHMTI